MAQDMTFERCRDVLSRIARFHEHMRQQYEHLEEVAERKRVQLVLDYLAGQEANLKASLDRYRSEAPEEVLETWIQYSTRSELPEPFRDAKLPADMDLDAVTDLAARFDGWLMESFQQLAEESDVPELQELFSALVEQQEKERRQLSKNLNALADI